MRSKLFVPGSRPDLFAKAIAGDADAVSFDLEDAVPEDGKHAAREAVAEFLASDAARGCGKTLLVRCNALDSPHFAADIAALGRPGAPFVLNLPKAESADDVATAIAALELSERMDGEAQSVALLATIETPRGWLQAAEIAAADARVTGLQLGLADLFEPYGIARDVEANVYAAMFTLKMAAAAAGVDAYDAARADVQDEAGFLREARRARELGFRGKSCIHPRQVAWANAAFAVSEAELAQARRVLAAAAEAQTQGRGAFLLDGRMVDAPFIARAEALLRQGHRDEATP